MSRWNETITLLSAPNAHQDEEGSWHEGERVGREVFCNPGVMGTMVMAQLRSSEVRTDNAKAAVNTGLRPAALVYVKAIDYEGEDQVIYRGEEMDVTSATSEGENMKLFIQRKIGND